MKTAVRVLAAMVLLILLLAVLLAAGLHIYLKTDRGGKRVMETVNSLIPGRIQAEAVSISLLGQSASLRNALLLGPGGEVVLESSEARMEIDALSLLRNRLAFAVISLKDPRIRLFTPGGVSGLNLLQAFAGGTPGRGEPRAEGGGGEEIAVVIEKIALENGVIQYSDEGTGVFVRLEDVDAQGSVNSARISGGIDGSIARMLVRMAGRSLELTGVRIEGEYEDGDLESLFAEASHSGFRASVKGSASDITTKPMVDVVMEYEGELSGLMSLLDPEREYSGRISGRAVAEGALGDPEGEAVVKYEGGVLAGPKVDGIQMEAALKDRIVHLKESLVRIASGKATAEGTIDLQEAFPEGFIESEPDLNAVSYEITSTATGMDLSLLFPGRRPYPSSLSGQAEITGRGILPPRIKADSEYVIHAQGIPPGFPAPVEEINIRGRAGLDFPVLSYTIIGDAAGVGDADVRGRLDLVTNRLQAEAVLDIRELKNIATALDIQARGALSARADLSGTLTDPVASGTLNIRGLWWQDYQVGDVSADLRLDDAGRLNLIGLRMNDAGPALSVQGGVRVFREGLTPDPDLPVSLDVRLKSARIDRLVLQEGMGGIIRGSVNVGGNLKSPSVSVDLAGEGVTFRDVNLGNIRLKGRLTDKGMQTDPVTSGDKEPAVKPAPAREKDSFSDKAIANAVRRLRDGILRTVSAAGDRRKTGSGTFSPQGPQVERVQFNPGLEFEITGEKINLQEFTSLAQGSLRYDARISGSLEHPRGTFRVSGTDIVLVGQEMEEVRASGEIRGRKVLILSLTAAVGQGGTITGSGGIDLGEAREYEIMLSTEGIPLRSLTSLSQSQVTSGTLVFALSGGGTLEDPRLTGNLRVVKPAVRGQVLEDVAVDLMLAGGVVNMTGRNDFGFKGTYNLQTRIVELQALFEDAELAPYFAIAGRPELRGVLSGSAEITGTVSDIENISANLNVGRAVMGIKGQDLMSVRGLVIEYRQGNLVIPESLISLPGGGSMMIRADAAPEGGLDLRARGRVPLQVMALFDPELADLTGTARFEMDVAGPVAKPQVQGDVYLEDVRYPLSYNGQLAHDINGRIRLSGEGVLVESLTGRLDDGYFEVQGRMDLEGLEPGRVNVTARVRSLPVVIPDTMDLLLEGDATLTGMPDHSLLQANVTILEALYYQDLQLNIVAEVGQRILGGGREVQIGRKPIDLPYLRNAELDISMARRGPVLIENNLAELTLSPDLHVTGTLNNPVITGRVSVIEGTVTYQRRTFEVTEGIVEFIDPYRTRAVVDLEAQGEIRDWMVFLSVSGPMDNLNIDLASDPPAEDSVILTLLATGRTPEELTGGRVAPRSPSSMLAELLAGTYGEELRETTGLDIFELETLPADEGAAAGDIRVTVGEELTRRLTVKYSLETDESEMTRTTLAEYKLLESLMINGFQDSQGVFGADIRFRIEFR